MTLPFEHRHLLGIRELGVSGVTTILDAAERWTTFNRQPRKQDDRLTGLTQVNAFFENSTRTLLSFEIAGKRLGAQVVNFQTSQSSLQKGETLLDTVRTINAMRPDVMVLRHQLTGAAAEVAANVDCTVINAGDGTGEHPTQALLDALTIRRRLGRLEDVTVAICGDVRHSRVAHSNTILLGMMGAKVRLVGPSNLLPDASESEGASLHTRLDEGIAGADIVMMLRIQRERMDDALLGKLGDYSSQWGLNAALLDRVAPNALVMHPGPINRGMEIDGTLADDPKRSLVLEQVEMGVAVRMACLDLLTRGRRA
jgi:aspartate carbamoyltransferase catalytic subunit